MEAIIFVFYNASEECKVVMNYFRVSYSLFSSPRETPLYDYLYEYYASICANSFEVQNPYFSV